MALKSRDVETSEPPVNEQLRRDRNRAYGSLENAFRFLQHKNHFGMEFIKKEFEALDYDTCENDIYLNNLKQQNFSIVALNTFRRYLNFILIGIIIGIIGTIIFFTIHIITDIKFRHLSKLVDSCHEGYCLYKVFFFWMLWVTGFVVVGMVLVTYIQPAAAGGGVAGVIAFLNGVDVQNTLNWSVVFFKGLSVICTIASNVAGGKEGPMIHIGASVGLSVLMLPQYCHLCTPFRNHKELREVVAAGVGGGVATAFGAPVGGFLLAVEESVSFLSMSLLFKIFMSSLLSVFTVNFILSFLMDIDFGDIGNKKLLYFDYLTHEESRYSVYEMPAFFLVGIVAGLVGALYVFLQKTIFVIRRKFIKKKWQKLLEGIIVSLITTIVHMSFTYLWKGCSPDKLANGVTLHCSKGYNEISLFTLHTGEVFINWLVHAEVDAFSLKAALSLCLAYFILCTITAQVNIAIGSFVPNIAVGAFWGRAMVMMFNWGFPGNTWAETKKYTFLAAATQLSGSLRISFSVVVIMCEATGSIGLIIPLMVSVITSKWVGNLLTPPLFESAIVLAGMPMLHPDPPAFTSEVAIRLIMAQPVVTLNSIVTVNEVANLLSSETHNGYPVLDGQGTLVGLVLAKQLLVFLKYKLYMSQENSLDSIHEIFNREFRKKITLNDVDLSDANRAQKLNLTIVMNPCPYTVRQNMSFERVYILFRQIGLRHLIVLDPKSKVVGMITRKDLAKYHAVQDGIAELPVV